MAGSARRRWPQEGGRAVLAAVALVYLEQLAFGANRLGLALGMAVVQAFGLLLLLSTRWGPFSLRAARVSAGTMVLAGAVVAAALFSLTPWAPGVGRRLWSYAGHGGGAAIDPLGVVVELVKLGGYACLFLSAAVLGAERERARLAFQALVTGALAFALLSLVLFAASPSTVFGVAKPSIAVGRLSAAFTSANVAATFFGMTAVLSAAGVLQARRRLGRGAALAALAAGAPVEIAALLASVACLALSASRAGMVAAAAGLVLLVAWEVVQGRRRGGGGMGATLLVALVPLAALLVSGSLLAQRYAAGAQEADARGVWLAEHWRAFLASPWFGYGLGSFDEVNRLIATRSTFAVLSMAGGSAHNVVVQWLEQGGLAGAAPMFLLVGWVLWEIARGGARRPHVAVWMRGVACASVVVLLHSMTDYALEEPSVAAFWTLLLGLGWAVARGPAGGDEAQSAA